MTFICKHTPPFSQSIIHWTVAFQNQESKAKIFFKMNEKYTTTNTKKLVVFLFKHLLSLNLRYDEYYSFFIDSENGLLSLKLKSFTSS